MIFVPIEYKEKVDSIVGNMATCLPYGFGKNGSIALYLNDDATDDEIVKKLQQNNIKFETTPPEDFSFSESGNDAADETYKGVFIDRKSGDFKILTGRFPDKKAMINKYGVLGKNYIARKVFEAPVFDWILKNAQSSLDSYLMLSTAFSKWKNNSILDKYYIKMVSEMPELFKIIRAGDKITEPQEESVFQEDRYEGNKVDFIDKRVFLTPYSDPEGKNIIEVPEYMQGICSTNIKWNNQWDIHDSEELYVKLRQFLSAVEKETEENVDHIDVSFERKNINSQPISFSKKEIEHGYTPHVGKNYQTNSHIINPDEQEKVQVTIYCKSPDGKVLPGGKTFYLIIQEENGINDKKIWESALQVLNTTYGVVEGSDNLDPKYYNQYVFMTYKGEEYQANRRTVYTNYHNEQVSSNPESGDYIYTRKGKVSYPEWRRADSVRPENDPNLRLNSLGNRAQIMQSNNKISDSVENYIDEEIKPLLREFFASDIYEFGGEDGDIKTVKFIVKNETGKDDVELINAPIAIDDINNATNNLKQRNPGKIIYVQINDDPVEIYEDDLNIMGEFLK